MFSPMGEKSVAIVLLLVAQQYISIAPSHPANHLEQRLTSNAPRPARSVEPSSFYCVSVGTWYPPSAGAVELEIVFAATALTKHPLMLVLVVVAGSR